MYATEATDCDLCGESVNNLKNHVRMSSDEDHGPQGRYPEGWNGENTGPGPSMTANTGESDSAGTNVATIDVDDSSDSSTSSSSDVDQEAAGDLESLTFGDEPADASDYECSACSDRLEYHQAECSCGEQPMWRAPR